jgi:translation initiation factor IF-1
VLSERLYRVELVNGHRFLGFVTARDLAAGMRFAPGETVQAAMSPLDLSKARLRKCNN